ncbi:hypothetical protein FACS1894110_16080 [Spirochaetia bacterium]|nr:hypothetical protein FACS1894110_16080 [Spirochaetia bacterium]
MKRSFFIHNFILITLPMLLVAALLSIVVIYITIDGSRKTIETINEQTVGRIRESTELMFSEADAQSLNYSISPFVMLRLEDLLQSGYADKEHLDVSNMIKTFLDSNVNSKAFLHSIYIYLGNDQGNFFATSVGVANKLNTGDSEWMDKVRSVPQELKQWLIIRSVEMYPMSNYSTRVITLYKRLYSSDRRNSIGVLVMNIHQDYLVSFYRGYITYPNQSIILLNDDGTVLCKAGALERAETIPVLADLQKNYFVSREENSAYGVTYLSLIPRNTLGLQSGEMMRMVLSAIILILVMGVLFAYIITRRNTRDVEGIIRLLDSAEKGEELSALRPSGDMYGYITQNIVKAFLEKNKLDKQLIEEKYLMEAMHFSLLQSQLNPHFLFNTLKNIFWKTVKLTGRPNDASRMIDLLSGLLRYALVNRDRYVTVAEEIENTRKYIEIQQMRFDHVFEVIWQGGEDLGNAKCIKFVLQPLVENSISHGLRDKKNGRIVISIQAAAGELLFSVTDNGHGFTPSRLEDVIRLFPEEKSPVENIGLYNLNKRLVLAYGAGAGLSIRSVPETETVIQFSVPLTL